MTQSQLTDTETTLLRRAIDLAKAARSKGNAPFGSILANAHGDVLREGENTEITHRDPTGHAEINILKNIHQNYPRETLRDCTIYASGEPCAMCAAAIVWSGVGRVVFSVASHAFPAKMGELPARTVTMKLTCRDVFSQSFPKIEVVGPILEDEGKDVLA